MLFQNLSIAGEKPALGAFLVFGIEVLLILSLAGFFLFPVGQGLHFLSYMLGISVVFAFCTDQRARGRLLNLKLAWLSAGLLGYLALSSAWSDKASVIATVKSFSHALLVMSVLAGLVMVANRGGRGIRVVLAAIVVAASTSALHFLISRMSDPEAVPLGRISTLSVAAMTYGAAAMIAFAFLLGAPAPRVRIGALALGCLLIAAAYLCDVNYVMMAASAGIVALLIVFTWKVRRSRRIYWALPILSGFALVLLAYSVSVLSSDRQLIWTPVLEKIFQLGPYFGQGVLEQMQPYVDCSRSDWIQAHFVNCVFAHPHNIYISTLYYGGLVGLFLLVMTLLFAIGVAFDARASREKYAMLACLVYGCVILFFDGNKILSKLEFTWLLFWLPVGIGMVLESNMESYE